MSGGLSGVILAGGASRRMGRDKALLDVDGRPLIAVVAERLRSVVDELVIASGDNEAYAQYADRCVTDIFSGVGTLGGLHAGLGAAAHDRVLVVGCDMPFLNPAVLRWFALAADGVDVVVLRQGEFLEPIHAVYRKSCLPAIEEVIRTGVRQAYAFYDQVKVRYVDPAEIEHLDPQLRSFSNVNTPIEWQRVSGER